MSKQQKRNTNGISQTTPTPVAPVTTAARTTEFNPNYDYVIKDLRRIGLLAGSFFVILIVLSFFLR
ncbi:MAG TPA: hypothetical protein PLA25_03050 [Anaerolineaceae bacterium]|jgi:hypothetical protein|nr:hypothetical protein [Longilinea sp.]HQF62518.1 hypothetical protein [Anaerolineaceae bacterium]HQH85700.1 hypothetical protein [Anaerolineaceae bacterium]HQN43086.1 hypothetical protein [Anaerolineaceae bacterium]